MGKISCLHDRSSLNLDARFELSEWYKQVHSEVLQVSVSCGNRFGNKQASILLGKEDSSRDNL